MESLETKISAAHLTMLHDERRGEGRWCIKPMSGLQGLVEAALSAFASERLPDLERSGGGRATAA